MKALFYASNSSRGTMYLFAFSLSIVTSNRYLVGNSCMRERENMDVFNFLLEYRLAEGLISL
ncbi:MAG: hypothetical protein ACI8RD_007445 [Bacillariaceae sp.]|jgi:hypothetical protein